jgi:outer membrane protein OmpA-like peptidoglycan-associated protein
MRNETRSAWSQVLFPLAGATGGLAALAISRRLVEISLNFGGVSPTPIRANLLLFGLGLALLAATVSAVGLVAWRRPRFSAAACMAGVAPVVVASTALLTAIHPGVGAFVSRERISTRDPVEPARILALPVFFANNDAKLSAGEAERVRQAFSTFADCGTESVFVRGFASSARFTANSDYRNRELANARASAVAAHLERFNRPVRVAAWTSYAEMVGNRRLRDTGLTEERLLQVEALNRRAEIFWPDQQCLDGGALWPSGEMAPIVSGPAGS